MSQYRIFTLSNDLRLIPKVIDEVMELIRSRCSSNDIQAISMGLYEVITNAVEHGNLNIDWETKNKALQAKRLDELIEERMNKEPYASRKVTIECFLERDKVNFVVGDEGDGFNHEEVPDPTTDENLSTPHGRGLFILGTCMDEVSFNQKGNRVSIVKYLADARQ